VIPGHGAPFTEIEQALAVARARLEGFVVNPQRHIAYAAKVMLKFKLLDAQQLERADLLVWAHSTHYLARLFAQQFADMPFDQGLDILVRDLVRSGAATLQGTVLHNA
jgi:hypothetical protein